MNRKEKLIYLLLSKDSYIWRNILKVQNYVNEFVQYYNVIKVLNLQSKLPLKEPQFYFSLRLV